MRIATALAAVVVFAATAGAQTQRRTVAAGSATLVITVTDPAAAPIGNVKVSVTALGARAGSTVREARTEGGRLTFENLPAGGYRLRFDCEGFVPLERELTARGGAPIDVKVTLAPAPPPPAPPAAPAPAPAPPPAPALSSDPLAIDMPAFAEKNYLRRGESKVSPLTCTTGGPAVMLQVKEALAEPARPDADEFLYVIAGEGISRAAGHDQPLRPGTFLMVPRGEPRSCCWRFVREKSASPSEWRPGSSGRGLRLRSPGAPSARGGSRRRHRRPAQCCRN